jgi:dihydropteroate synthase
VSRTTPSVHTRSGVVNTSSVGRFVLPLPQEVVDCAVFQRGSEEADLELRAGAAEANDVEARGDQCAAAVSRASMCSATRPRDRRRRDA